MINESYILVGDIPTKHKNRLHNELMLLETIIVERDLKWRKELLDLAFLGTAYEHIIFRRRALFYIKDIVISDFENIACLTDYMTMIETEVLGYLKTLERDAAISKIVSTPYKHWRRELVEKCVI